MNEKYTWDLTDIFKSNDEFQSCKSELNSVLERISNYKGKLQNANSIVECYTLYEEGYKILEKLYAYGMLKYHQDMSNQESIKLFKEVESINTNFALNTSFIVPEISEIDEESLKSIINEKDIVGKYERVLKEILRDKKHILSKTEEKLLANYGEIFSSFENTYDVLTNTEFKYGTLINENGEEVQMTDGTYTNFLRNKNQNVRKQAFDLMYDKYKEFQNTIAELYLTRVKSYTINSRLRNYKNSLEKAVENDDATINVYESLIQSVNKNLSVNHKFMALKKKMLKTEKMHLYDIYMNPIEIQDEKITFKEARDEVLSALEIMGEEYTNKLKEAFENRWIDVYEMPNKRGGAYSMGVYGVHPFVLTNFIGSKRDVSTIAHELGHSMHSYYSNTNQSPMDSNYTIMVAEVASTVNEILLASYQIDKETDPTKKAEILYEMLEMIRATLFRQAMFAEFEKIVHEKVEKMQMLSCEDLNDIYYNLNKKYFGEDVVIDEKIKYEWLRIPHFYTCFYVYKYATGISSAIAIASKILSKEPGFVEKYIEMLKQGCTKKSVELLKMVDVDLENMSPYEDAIKFFNDKIDELASLI